MPDQPGGDTENRVAGSLHENEQFVMALLETAAQAILATDRSGKIVLANRKSEEIFGYTREELTGAHIDQLVPEGVRRGHQSQIEEYFDRPRARPMGIGLDLQGRRKDGTIFPIEVSLSHVQSGGRAVAIAFVTDTTRRKQLEEQLMHAQKMEAVGRLAGGVAHDFNNMLTVIAGYARMVLDDAGDSAEQRECAEEILRAAERSSTLTHQLLAFSRRQIMQSRVFNVNEVLSQTESMLRRLIGEDIDLTLVLGDELGNIKTDPRHVEQALVNMAVNARDAMPGGGRLTIETANVSLDEAYAGSHLGLAPGQYVMITVSDTGHGMDAETRRRVFEPFFTTKERGKGTGLGLATVYGTVKQAGGDIWVYSEPGRGTSFKLYFPRVDQPAVFRQDDAETSVPGGSDTILLVEDERAVRELAGKLLRQLGYTVLVAANGAEALAVSRGHIGHIALLLTDVVMPGMSGRKLADLVLEGRPAIKVLFVSGYTEDMAMHGGALDPDVEFLPKPFSREVLARKVREVLAKA